MKLPTAKAISEVIADEATYGYIIPKPFDFRVMPVVAAAAAELALITVYVTISLNNDTPSKNLIDIIPAI